MQKLTSSERSELARLRATLGTALAWAETPGGETVFRGHVADAAARLAAFLAAVTPASGRDSGA